MLNRKRCVLQNPAYALYLCPDAQYDSNNEEKGKYHLHLQLQPKMTCRFKFTAYKINNYGENLNYQWQYLYINLS